MEAIDLDESFSGIDPIQVLGLQRNSSADGPYLQYNTHTMAGVVSRTERELDLRHLWHGNLQHYGLEKRPPLEIARAEGCLVYDSEGRRYLDAMAGLWCVNV